jgi:predicted Zn-dependent protease
MGAPSLGSLSPGNITLKGTLAGMLCENDQWDDAEPLLSEVLSESPVQIDQGITAFYMARICHRRGDTKGARDWIAYSKYIYPDKRLARRIVQGLPGALNP